MKTQPGDLVEVGGIWSMKGIVLADDTAWYVISGHYDIADCIVSEEDVLGIVTPRAIDPDMIPYLRREHS